MIGRLGKAAAEIALQFMSEGMPLDDAVRAGAKLMDEELSPAAEMMLKQNKSVNTVSPTLDRDSVAGKLLDYDPRRDFRSIQDNITASYWGKRPRGYRQFELENELQNVGFGRWGWPEMSSYRQIAANRYAVRQLLLDAAEGDMDVAAALAQRLGFEGLL